MNGAATINEISSEQLEIRDKRGWSSLFGLPFFAAGIFVLLIGLQVIPVDNAADTPGWAWPLMILMGLAFVIVGTGLMLGRSWIYIDKSAGEIRKSWGLFIPMRSEVKSLHEYNRIVMTHDSGDSDSPESYPVALASSNGDKQMLLSNHHEYSRAVKDATTVADFMECLLIDATTDHHTTYKPGEMDGDFVKKLREKQDEFRYVSRPMELKSEIDYGNGELRIKVPHSGFRLHNLFPILIPVIVFIFFYPEVKRFFEETNTPKEIVEIMIYIGIALFAIFPALSILRAVVHSIRGHTLIKIDRTSLLIKEQEAFRSKKTEIPLEDLIGIDYTAKHEVKQRVNSLAGEVSTEHGYRRREVPDWVRHLAELVGTNGIAVKSKGGLHTVALKLPDDEIKYIHALIFQRLSQ